MKRNKNKHTTAGQKTVIKRVARRKKRVTTQEKVLGALGVGSALVGGVSGVAPKASSTQFVRSDESSAASKTGKVRETLSRVFGIREAKASEWDPGADLKIGQVFPEGIMAGNASSPAQPSQVNAGGVDVSNQGGTGGTVAQNTGGAATGVRPSVTDVASDGEFEGTEEGEQGAGGTLGGGTGLGTNQTGGLRLSGSDVSDDDTSGGATRGAGAGGSSVRPSVSDVADDDGFSPAGQGAASGLGTGGRASVTSVSSNDGEVEVLNESQPASADAEADDEVEVSEESVAPAASAHDEEVEVLDETAPGPGAADDEVEVHEEAAAQPAGNDEEVEVLDESAPPAGTGDEEVEGTEDQVTDEQEIENEEVDASSGGSGSEDEEVEVLQEAGETGGGSGGGGASGGTGGGSGGGTVGTQTSFGGAAALGTAPSGLRYDDIVRAQQPSGLQYADLVRAQQPSGLRYADVVQSQQGSSTEASGATYTVERGDTLSSISQRLYGDASRWREILKANLNVVQNPRLLRAGSVLTIPGALPRTPPPASASAAAAAFPSGGTYAVQRGDTLWDLAGRFYGDSRAWTTLRDANIGKFSDQYSLGVGTRLAVPANVTSRAAPPAQAAASRARAPAAPRVTAAASAPVVSTYVAPVQQPVVRPSVTDVGSDDEVEGVE